MAENGRIDYRVAKAKRRKLTQEAVDVLANSLHAKFCDDDTVMGGWDRAVVEHVITALYKLEAAQFSGVLASLALDDLQSEYEIDRSDIHKQTGDMSNGSNHDEGQDTINRNP